MTSPLAVHQFEPERVKCEGARISMLHQVVIAGVGAPRKIDDGMMKVNRRSFGNVETLESQTVCLGLKNSPEYIMVP